MRTPVTVLVGLLLLAGAATAVVLLLSAPAEPVPLTPIRVDVPTVAPADPGVVGPGVTGAPAPRDPDGSVVPPPADDDDDDDDDSDDGPDDDGDD